MIWICLFRKNIQNSNQEKTNWIENHQKRRRFTYRSNYRIQSTTTGV